jgi:hypothetical protein
MKTKEEEMKIKKFKGLFPVLKLLFVLLCMTLIDISVHAEVFAGNLSDADLLKSDARYTDRGTTIFPTVDKESIAEDGENKNLLFDDLHQYQLCQQEKGKKSGGNVIEEEDAVKDESGDKRSGSGVVFELIQYCQGRFKRLGGIGVEIITIRCPKVDDSCNCEADKKSPTKWIECGGARKESTIGSELLSCESKIIGSSAPVDSE